MNEIVDPARVAEVEDLVRRNTTAAYRAPEVCLSHHVTAAQNRALLLPLSLFEISAVPQETDSGFQCRCMIYGLGTE
jgi:hypothetical protein